MFEHKKIRELEDYFLKLSDRNESGVYFYRINGYHEQIKQFLQKYFEAARSAGVVIEGKMPNPDEKNLSYYQETMGTDFAMSVDFFLVSLKKWMPRMNEYQRRNVALSIYDNLDGMRKSGKNENMLKNAYIKFMCWLYYKFERIANRLGENNLPKLLYEGEISRYELMMLSILSHAGCDIVLLQQNGDSAYQKADPALSYSYEFQTPGLCAFPEGFGLKQMQEEMRNDLQRERLYGQKPALQNCTNAWISGKAFEAIKTAAKERGSDPRLFYNCFIQMNGVEDKLTYQNDVYRLYQDLKSSKRKLLVIENEIPKPTMEEISSIRRNRYERTEQMLMDLSSNLVCTYEKELERLMRKAFLDIMLEASGKEGMNLNKLTNKAVYLLCWAKRYQADLFSGQKLPEISCLIAFHVCVHENEALFFRFLSKLPVDLLMLNPGKKESCLNDAMLYEINYANTLALEKFPSEGCGMQTAAYHAERELDELMYQDSGMYRIRQFDRANAVLLRTTYEEISILWDEELTYRPSFGTADGTVSVPVLFAKVSGVKNGDVSAYWSEIKKLATKDTVIAKSVPYLKPTDENSIKRHAAEFFKNGRLLKEKIKAHPCYPYGFLREETQDHILDKLALLIHQKAIRGIFSNGAEYTAISVVLNLNKEITRLLQKFDFTKKNPKLIFVHTSEAMFSLEDAILATFLNLAGFDVIVFAPAGYRGMEKFFQHNRMEEHEIGEYMYDLTVPDFGRISSGTRQTWRDKIFKRGR